MEDCLIEDGRGLRFRLAEPEDDGEDMWEIGVVQEEGAVEGVRASTARINSDVELQELSQFPVLRFLPEIVIVALDTHWPITARQ